MLDQFFMKQPLTDRDKMSNRRTQDDGVMIKAHIAFGRYVAPLGHIILSPSQPVFALSP